MPCDTFLPKGVTLPQRKAQIQEAVERLNKALSTGEVKVVINRVSGAVAFSGEWQRNGVSDLCAYRKLQVMGSAALRSALARAEVVAGRKVNEQALAAGEHSHDGGKTWGKH